MQKIRSVLGVLAAGFLLAACAAYTISGDGVMPFPVTQKQGGLLWSAPGDHVCRSEKKFLDVPGTLAARECVLFNIYAARDRNNSDHLSRYIDQLAGFYHVRARRQQMYADSLAGTTLFGAAGAGFSGRVGAATQRGWLALAFAPIVISNINSNEPTRDLFYAGAVGLKKMQLRYELMSDMIVALEGVNVSMPNCEEVGGRASAIAGWPASMDREALLTEAQRLTADCQTIKLSATRSTNVLTAARAARALWTKELASSAINLDDMLVKKDYDFRFSPAETIGAIAAAPFRTLDTILSGQDTGEAVNRLRTNLAFDGMDIVLPELPLPDKGVAPTPIAVIPTVARARAVAPSRAAGSVPSDEVAANTVNYLVRIADELAAAQAMEVHRSAMIDRLHAAATATRLTFLYTPATNSVKVDLTPPLPAITGPAPTK